MDKIILIFIKLLNPIFIKQGIQLDQLYGIVETKLMMDKRRVNLQWKQNQQAQNRNQLLMMQIFYGLMGAFIGATIIVIPSFVISMTIVHGYIIFMMAMTLITDFSNVLLDTTDNQILLPRPINSKTIFMARLLHILIYLLQFSLVLSIGPLVCTIIKYGFGIGIAFCFTSILSILLSLFLTYLLYLLMMRFSSIQKVKSIITGFQIFMAIFFAVGFQIIPRLMDYGSTGNHLTFHGYYYFLPPFWMAYGLETLQRSVFDSMHLIMFGFAVFIPVILFWFLNRFLAPGFAKKMEAMQTDPPAATKKLGEKSTAKTAISAQLAPFFCRGSLEKASFEFAWKMTGREKSFKLQFYPSMSYIIVFLAIYLIRADKPLLTLWKELPTTKNYLFCIYVPMFASSSSLIIMAFNENFLASWIFHSLPVKKPGELITGAVKALYVKFFIPVFLITFLLCFYIWGLKIIDDFILGFLINAFCFLIFAMFADHYLPFSRQPNTQQQSGRVALVLLQMAVVSVFIGIHFLLVDKTTLILSLSPFLILGCWLLLTKLRNLPWNKIAV